MERLLKYDSYSLPLGTILHETYQINSILGEGGFGIIYACENTITKEIVAIKEYFPSGLAKREPLAEGFSVQPLQKCKTEFIKGHRHFLEEAKILKDFQNLEAIATVYDFFEENNTAYIVMEYIEGPTLEEYIQNNGAMSYKETIQLITPVIHSLNQLHEKGFIHRDISPDNLLLGLDNRLHLIDFGAAREKSAGSWQNQQTIILKKGYAPPEQYLSTGSIGAWVDVYALSATMYFAISGRPPLASIDRLQQDLLQPLTVYADVPPQVAGIIERGMALHPANRFSSMKELDRAISDPLSNEERHTILGSALSRQERDKIMGRSPKKRLLEVSILLFCVLFAGAGLWLWFHEEQSSDASPTTGINSPMPISQEEKTMETVAPTPSTTETGLEKTSLLSMVDVTGNSLKKAKKSIRALDDSVEIKIRKEYSDTVKKGKVISQSIVPNTMFSPGAISKITLTISKGARANSTASPLKSKNTPRPSSKETDDFDIKTKTSKDSFQID